MAGRRTDSQAKIAQSMILDCKHYRWMVNFSISLNNNFYAFLVTGYTTPQDWPSKGFTYHCRGHHQAILLIQKVILKCEHWLTDLNNQDRLTQDNLMTFLFIYERYSGAEFWFHEADNYIVQILNLYCFHSRCEVVATHRNVTIIFTFRSIILLIDSTHFFIALPFTELRNVLSLLRRSMLYSKSYQCWSTQCLTTFNTLQQPHRQFTL